MAIEIAPPEPDSPADRKRRRNRQALLRLAAWGGTASLALAVLALTTQTQNGSERLQLAWSLDNLPARAIAQLDTATRARDKEAAAQTLETQRLEAQVRSLAADRDRLTARIAGLEHSLDDVTGSIKRQAALAAEASAAKVSPPVEPPRVNTVRTETYTAPPASAPKPAENPATQVAPATPAAPAAEVIPLPPTRIATAPASEPAAEPPNKPEIGVDLGGAHSMEILHARWTAVKANFGPLLAGLHPLTTQDHRPGMPEYRLLVGPLPNAAAVAKLCARFAAAHVTCRLTKFEGERIAQQ